MSVICSERGEKETLRRARIWCRSRNIRRGGTEGCRVSAERASRSYVAADGSGASKVTLDDHIGAAQPYDCQILLLDQALGELASMNPRQVEIVELRYFGGLTEEEVEVLLSLSLATVTLEWQTARAAVVPADDAGKC